MSRRSRLSLAITTLLLAAVGVVAGPLCKGDPEVCAETIRKQLSGRRSLGVTMVSTHWGTVIDSVLPMSPAARAGIRPDDRIVMINRHDCTGADPQDVKELLVSEGGDGSLINLIVARPGEFKRIRARFDTLSPEQIEAIVQRHLRTAHAE